MVTDLPSEADTALDKLLDPQSSHPLDWTYKGLPPRLEGVRTHAISGLAVRVFSDECLFPIAVLKRSAVVSNSKWMKKFLERTGLEIAPHGKTTMAPDLLRLQLAAGAWGLTAATLHHVRAYRQFGVRRIILANQLLGVGNIDWVINELKRDQDFDFYCLVDSLDSIMALARRAEISNLTAPFKVLLEVGCQGGRTGARSIEQAIQIAKEIRVHGRFVALAGVETFEGIVHGAKDSITRAGDILATTTNLVHEIDRLGLFDESRIIVTAGGSALFDLAAQAMICLNLSRPIQRVLRSGCYLVHDSEMCARAFAAIKERMPDISEIGFDLQPALEIWAHVLSVPERGRLVCGFGKRDVGFDSGMPRLISWVRPNLDHKPKPLPVEYHIASLWDQHACVEGPEDSPLRVGDLVSVGISHPCTTLDKWRGLLVVDDDYVVHDLVRTYF